MAKSSFQWITATFAIVLILSLEEPRHTKLVWRLFRFWCQKLTWPKPYWFYWKLHFNILENQRNIGINISLSFKRQGAIARRVLQVHFFFQQVTSRKCYKKTEYILALQHCQFSEGSRIVDWSAQMTWVRRLSLTILDGLWWCYYL